MKSTWKVETQRPATSAIDSSQIVAGNLASILATYLESQSRLADRTHPADTKRFMDRYESFIKSGDPYYSPYLENEGFTHLPKLGAECPLNIPSRLVTMPWAPSKQLQKKGAA
jgi:hypothetical protein